MTDDNKDNDGWVMSSPHQKKSVEDFLSDESEVESDTNISDEDGYLNLNPLEGQLMQWGMRVPPKIDDPLETDATLEMPDVIAQEHLAETQNKNTESGSIIDHLGTKIVEDNLDDLEIDSDELKDILDNDSIEVPEKLEDDGPVPSQELSSDSDDILPDNDDLEYPSIGGEEVNLGAEEDLEQEEAKPRSKLISTESFEDEVKVNQEEDDTDPTFEITQEIKHDLEEELKSEVTPDDFWATDDFPSISNKQDIPVTEVKSSAKIKDDFFKNIDTDFHDDSEELKIIPSKKFSSITLDEVGQTGEKVADATVSSISEDEIVEKVKDSLTPVIEKIVRDLFQEKIEQVAWEVIPDLAENIIKHEVEDIAKQVYLSKDKE